MPLPSTMNVIEISTYGRPEVLKPATKSPNPDVNEFRSILLR